MLNSPEYQRFRAAMGRPVPDEIGNVSREWRRYCEILGYELADHPEPVRDATVTGRFERQRNTSPVATDSDGYQYGICWHCGMVATCENAIAGNCSESIIHVRCLDPDFQELYFRTHADARHLLTDSLVTY